MRRFGLVFAAFGLAACERGGDPVQQALREESAANHAEVAFAREAQAQRRATQAVERQAEIDRLRREVLVAEAALRSAEGDDLRAAAQASLDESRAALAALEAEG